MKNENSSDAVANLRLYKDVREDVVRAKRSLGMALTLFDDKQLSGVELTKELSSLKGAMTKANEVEFYIAKCIDQFRTGEGSTSALNLEDARREIFDRLAKIAEARRG